ncbi:endonuclease II, partial [Salmonella enterica subsp. enterica serovar Braenderup]|nr:endonuclease II [Salmonella enterica subsp. enterica serovar Braenderup]
MGRKAHFIMKEIATEYSFIKYTE